MVDRSHGWGKRGSVLLAGLLVFSLLAAGCAREEPRYKRVPVSTYIKRLVQTDRDATLQRSLEAVGAVGAPAVPYLMKAWEKNKGVEARCRLAKGFAAIGPDAAPAVDLLVAALESLDEELVTCAAEALGAIGPASAPAVPRLAQLLRSTGYGTQISLLRALRGIGPAAVTQLDLVLEASLREKTRDEATLTLAALGPAAWERMVRWLKEGSVAQRRVACEVLPRAGTEAAMAPAALAGALRDASPEVRIAAARGLEKFGPRALEVQSALIAALADRDSEVREAVVAALAALGPDGGAAVIAALTNPDWRVRLGAVLVASRFSGVREKALPKLIARLGDSSDAVRLAAIDALTAFGPEIIPAMVRQLRSGEVYRRFGAARVLGNLGPEASQAVPALRPLLRDSDSLVREEAARAIARIGG